MQLKPNNNLLARIQKRLVKEYRLLTQPKIIKIEGIKIRTSFAQVSEAVRRAMYIGEYESSELRAVKFQLCENDIVMEIGAGIGLLSTPKRQANWF